MASGLARISPFRWTWEWLFLLLLPFAIFWHTVGVSQLGHLDIAEIASRGQTAQATITRISGGPTDAKDRGVAAAFRRYEVYFVDLGWVDRSGVQRRASNVRVAPDAGQSIGFGATDRVLPMSAAIRYKELAVAPGKAGGAGLVNPELPACEPAANCQVLVLDAAGGSGFDLFTRFWLEWGAWVVAVCLIGFVVTLGLRLAGRI